MAIERRHRLQLPDQRRDCGRSIPGDRKEPGAAPVDFTVWAERVECVRSLSKQPRQRFRKRASAGCIGQPDRCGQLFLQLSVGDRRGCPRSGRRVDGAGLVELPVPGPFARTRERHLAGERPRQLAGVARARQSQSGAGECGDSRGAETGRHRPGRVSGSQRRHAHPIESAGADRLHVFRDERVEQRLGGVFPGRHQRDKRGAFVRVDDRDGGGVRGALHRGAAGPAGSNPDAVPDSRQPRHGVGSRVTAGR